MHAYGVSIYYAWTGNQIKWTWAEPFEINAKVELVSNFIVDNKSRFFFDA